MVPLKRICVLGGGIGGLSMAAALLRCGFPVDVYEQSDALREAGAGVGLWSNALASLDALGAGAAVRNGSLPLRVLAGARPDGTSLSRISLDEFGPEFAEAACRIVLRSTLLAALARCVPAQHVHLTRRAVRVEAEGATARVFFESGESCEADLVIGADGLHSVVRPALVGRDAIRYSGQTCFRGIAPIVVADLDTLREIQGPGQRAAVHPVNENTVYWWVAYNAPGNAPVPVQERHSHLLKRCAGWPVDLEKAIRATPQEAILHNDLVDRAPIRRYARGPLALMGDAAHPTTPNLGQGANMAIDDAIALARALHQENCLEDAWGRYHQERLDRTRLIVKRSWNFGKLCRWHSRVAVAMREFMVSATPKSTMRSMLRWQILESVGGLPT